MENFTCLVILFITFASVHLTSAGLIVDQLIEKSQLYYINPLGEEIPITEVENFVHNQLVIYCHGFIANPTHDSIMPVRNGLLAAAQYDVIACDWSSAAKMPYLQARGAIAPVGYFLYAKLWESLITHNISVEDVCCIGHSLGAHVCGNMGKASDGRLGKVIGLDPAKPFIKEDAPDCMRQTDALHVVCLHTGAPFFGQLLPLGHVDIYSNFGVVNQPGCLDPSSVVDFLTKGNACSHNRACQICGESILAKLNFAAIRCYFGAIENKSVAECQKNLETKTNRSSLQNDIINRNAGENLIWFNLDIPESTRGTFIMTTNERAPFGKGAYYLVPEDYA